MTYELRITKSFKSDYKKLNKQEIEATDGIIKRLLADEVLEAKYCDHSLKEDR
ncbi:type II toxin-antitoxin system YafQ family toxin [Treponema socranskii]|uniref:type II toxin-antitoxin system YafQ family toxin n=1 Tax=Treponema socranskii TaxID=53419 RepID=UPI003D6E9696